MELWEHPGARVDALVIHASRAEIESGDIQPALTMLEKLLSPEVARRTRGRLIFGVYGYDDDPRELYQISEVRAWMHKLDRAFPYWFYFMDTGPHSTLPFVAFSLCRIEKVPGGSIIPPDELARFMAAHFMAMNQLAAKFGDAKEDTDARSREIGKFFA